MRFGEGDSQTTGSQHRTLPFRLPTRSYGACEIDMRRPKQFLLKPPPTEGGRGEEAVRRILFGRTILGLPTARGPSVRVHGRDRSWSEKP